MSDVYDLTGRLMDEPDDPPDTTEEQDALLDAIRAYDEARDDLDYDNTDSTEWKRLTGVINRLLSIAREDRVPEKYLKRYGEG